MLAVLLLPLLALLAFTLWMEHRTKLIFLPAAVYDRFRTEAERVGGIGADSYQRHYDRIVPTPWCAIGIAAAVDAREACASSMEVLLDPPRVATPTIDALRNAGISEAKNDAVVGKLRRTVPEFEDRETRIPFGLYKRAAGLRRGTYVPSWLPV
jgi:hypothetical protein